MYWKNKQRENGEGEDKRKEMDVEFMLNEEEKKEKPLIPENDDSTQGNFILGNEEEKKYD